MPDYSTESHGISEPHRRSLDLTSKRSVTVPSSLADSAISLSTDDSSVALSSAGKNRSDDISDESRQVCHETSPRGSTEDNMPTNSLAKDKRKKIGLSRLLRSRQKDL